MVADLGWVDLNFDIPPSAKLCWGSWEFGRTGRTGRAAGPDDGTYKSKATQPRVTTTSVTLYSVIPKLTKVAGLITEPSDTYLFGQAMCDSSFYRAPPW